ncbi:hypothetical protein K438DRAFT_126710 [Mycena galopus ATCC 62051]|nr:hypothetical protein K438DRAFT_126710 [Mycena galopus ATCC 62051]
MKNCLFRQLVLLMFLPLSRCSANHKLTSRIISLVLGPTSTLCFSAPAKSNMSPVLQPSISALVLQTEATSLHLRLFLCAGLLFRLWIALFALCSVRYLPHSTTSILSWRIYP